MNRLEMENLGFQELDDHEMVNVEGGYKKIDYLSLGYGDHGNSLLYVAETGVNVAKMVANAGIWVANIFAD